ncbi:MAG: hypothetical protein N2316_12730 [Spirochaetes bacterium]|nr:hypothetical protein [Spirochaetota bacterium]
MEQEKFLYKTMNGNKENALLEYRSFWEVNLQKVEEIFALVEKHIILLEKKQKAEKENYQEIEKTLDLLLSIYSSYNCLKGREYLLKLKSCLKDYFDTAENQKTRFNVLSYLVLKARELYGESLKDFPVITHEYPNVRKHETLPLAINQNSLTHRWITFRQSRWWFIAPYEDCNVIEKSRGCVLTNENGWQNLLVNNNRFKILFFNLLDHNKANTFNYYIIVHYNHSSHCFAVTEIGKRIMASRDIITENLKKYHSAKINYIRLFGKNHIYFDKNTIDYFSP